MMGRRGTNEIAHLRRELADVEAELARLAADDADYDSLVAQPQAFDLAIVPDRRRRALTSEGRRHQLQQALGGPAASCSRSALAAKRIADVDWPTWNSISPVVISAAIEPTRHLTSASPYGQQDYHALCRDRDAIQRELDRVTASLDACLSEAAEVGRTLRTFSSNGRVRTLWRRKYIDPRRPCSRTSPHR